MLSEARSRMICLASQAIDREILSALIIEHFCSYFEVKVQTAIGHWLPPSCSALDAVVL